MDGYGILYYSNGDRFEGNWNNNDKSDYGIYYYSNGDIFKGGWKDGKKHGYGVFYYSKRDFYKGEWKNDVKEGYGIYFNNFFKWRYEGEWKNDVKEGYGKEILSKGLIYEGKWVKNKIEEFHYIILIMLYIIHFLSEFKKLIKRSYLFISIVILLFAIIKYLF